MGKLRKAVAVGAAAATVYTVYRVRYRNREQPVETFVDDVSRVTDSAESTSLTEENDEEEE